MDKGSSKLKTIIQQLKEHHPDEIVLVKELPPNQAKTGDVPSYLHPKIRKWLKKEHIYLYEHQIETLSLLIEGKNVIITTPTASGKSLSYQLVIFNEFLTNPKSTALYLSPLKALSRDQEGVLRRLDSIFNTKAYPATYDGDTSPRDKRRIRIFSKIILSNPHAMHQYLDWHPKWRRFFSNLKYIILDEAHAYRGVFGSGVAHLMRRIRRILHHYGATPRFVLLSATLGNAREFAEKLMGLPFVEVSKNGAPTSRRYFLIWNPKLIDKELGLRNSTFMDASRILATLTKRKIQTLLFVDSRKMTELIANWSKELIIKEGLAEAADTISAYRAGYLPKDRRQLEQRIKDGSLIGITTTSALELGIDIGSLDAVVLVGYPGSIMQTWQRIGRAGRQQQDALVFLVCHNNPLDQYIARHPEHLFSHPPENAVLNLENPFIMTGHLLCASKEMPLSLEELEMFWPELTNPLEIMQDLEARGLVKQVSPNTWMFSGDFRPSSYFTIKGMLPSYFLKINGRTIEVLDERQAFEQAFVDSVYIHQGEQYFVEQVDHSRRTIMARPTSVDYYTEIIKHTDVHILDEIKSARLGPLIVWLGKTEVIHKYPGYLKKKYDQVLSVEKTSLPSRSFETEALWIEPFRSINHRWWELFPQQHYMAAGLHAAEHALIHVFPILSLCDVSDIGGVSYPTYPFSGNPTIFLYEGHQGGTGLLREALNRFSELVSRALELVLECPCTSRNGCPACIQDRHCGNDNFYLLKEAGIEVLSWLEAQLAS